MVPESIIELAWIPGESNSADMVSKIFHNPFTRTNSNVFRLGAECFRENDGKRAKKLVEAGPQESFGNIEGERLQCMRCEGDETDCGTVMLIRTRESISTSFPECVH